MEVKISQYPIKCAVSIATSFQKRGVHKHDCLKLSKKHVKIRMRKKMWSLKEKGGFGIDYNILTHVYISKIQI